jgi:hypothetical protein
MRYLTSATRIPMLLTICAALFSPRAPAALISIQPATVTVGSGRTFDLEVWASGVTDLYGFQFDIDFDPAILSAAGVAEGAFLPGPTMLTTSFVPGLINNSAGDIAFIGDSRESNVPGLNGGGVLVSIGFTALNIGTSSIDLTNIVLLNSSLSATAVAAAPGTVVVVAVPEPRSVVLAFSCLALVALSRLRRK